MSQVVITAESRTGTGKAEARRLRRSGKVPAILYGEKDVTPTPIILDALDIYRLLRKDHAIINVQINGEEKQAVIKDVQKHPVSGSIMHVDFQRIAAGHTFRIEVSLRLVGDPVGFKAGGVLSTQKHELLVSVLPRFLPDYIDVDISGLEVGDSIRVKDLQLENIEILDDPEEVICSVVAPRRIEEEEEEKLAEEEEEESAEPEVITSRQPKEEEEE